MNRKEKMQFQAADLALGQILKYIDKDPRGNLKKLVNVSEKLAGTGMEMGSGSPFPAQFADIPSLLGSNWNRQSPSSSWALRISLLIG